MPLSIIIVNYNVKYFLEQCLASVRLAMLGIQGEVWVVDNHSSDGSVEYLQPLFPEVHFIPLVENLGFARANNLALQQCTGRYVLFLNPDTIIAEDTLHQTLAFMEAHAHAGALGIRMIDGSGRFLPESKRGFPSPLASLYKMLGLAALFPRSKHFAAYYAGQISQHTTAPVEVLAGAFMLVRRQVLDTVGSFDEQFFMYGEDIDLSYRIVQAGWKNYYFAESTIIHFKGESTSRGSLNYVKVFYGAMALFVKKHFKGRGSAAYKMLLFAGIALRAGLSALGRLALAGKKSSATLRPAIQPGFEVLGWPDHIAFPRAILVDGHALPAALHKVQTGKADNWQGRQVLLAVGDTLVASAAIDLLEKHGNIASFWIHLIKTNGLVCSHNKKQAGISAVFTTPQ